MPPRQRRPLSPGARTGFQFLTAGITGLATFGAITTTGAVVGEAASDFNDEQARRQAAQDAAQEAARRAALPTVVVVQKRRPHKTVVRTRVATSPGQIAVTPGSGGTVRRPPTTAAQSSGPGPAPAAAAPAPAAPPAPAPSSGS